MKECVKFLVVAVLGSWTVVIAQGSIPEFARLPGEPGKDYPTLAEIPETHFSCRKQPFLGYYADVSTGCQVYHVCEAGGKQSSFLCPNGTIFNQLTGACDEWYHVDCALSPQLFWRNKYSDQHVSRKNSNQHQSDEGATESDNNDKQNHKNEHDKNLPEGTSSDIKKLKESVKNELTKKVHDHKIKHIAKRKQETLRITAEETVSQRHEKDNQTSISEQLSTAEKIFLVLNFIDRMKADLSTSQSTKSDAQPHNSDIGEKLFKILSVFEAAQNYDDAKAEISNNLRHNFNEDKIQRTLKQYRQLNNTNSNIFVNKSDVSDKYPYNTDSTFETENKEGSVSDKTAIDTIKRILEIAEKTFQNNSRENINNIYTNNSLTEPNPLPESQSDNAHTNAGPDHDGYHKNIHEIINSEKIQNWNDDDSLKNIDIIDFRKKDGSHKNLVKNETTEEKGEEKTVTGNSVHNMTNYANKYAKIINTNRSNVSLNDKLEDNVFKSSVPALLSNGNRSVGEDINSRDSNERVKNDSGLISKDSNKSSEEKRSSLLRDTIENLEDKSDSTSSNSSENSTDNSDSSASANQENSNEEKDSSSSDSDKTSEENTSTSTSDAHVKNENSSKANYTVLELIPDLNNMSGSNKIDSFRGNLSNETIMNNITLPDRIVDVYNDTTYKSDSSISNFNREHELDRGHAKDSLLITNIKEDEGSTMKPSVSSDTIIHLNTTDNSQPNTLAEGQEISDTPIKSDNLTKSFSSMYSELTKALLGDEENKSTISNSDEMDEDYSGGLMDVLKGIYATLRR